MNKRNCLIVLAAFVLWGLLPRAMAHAQVPADSFPYVSCSTGAAPFTYATVPVNTSQEVQAFCNPGDSATGGGYELMNVPPPTGVIVTTPLDDFHQTTGTSGPLDGITYPDGWQVVLTNTNLNPFCFLSKPNPKFCPPVQYRVCVACVTTVVP